MTGAQWETPGNTRKNDQVSSRLLAFAVAGVNLAICAALAAVLLVTGRDPDSTAAPATESSLEPSTVDEAVPEAPPYTSTPPDTTDPVTTVPPTPTVPSGFVTVTGPGGLTTAIPAGWPTKRASGEGSMQADDPSGTLMFVRYGGSPEPAADIYTVHADYQATFGAGRPGFESWRLEQTVLRGFAAVDWEFEWDAPEGRRHVRSFYWRAQGYEYFVYSSAPVAHWSQAEHILSVMIDNASP